MKLLEITKGFSAKVLLTIGVKLFMNTVLSLIRRVFWPSHIPLQPKKICVHRVGQIGDMVCALPALEAIRQKFGDAELVLLTSPGQKGNPNVIPMFQALSWIDKIKVYYSEDIHSLTRLRSFGKELRHEHFDLWIQLPQDLTTFRTEVRNMLFLKLIGVPWAGGFRVNTVKLSRKEQARELDFSREDEVLLQVLKDIGIESDRSGEKIFSVGEIPSVDNLLSSLPKNKEGLMALAPGGKRALNQWPIDRFTEIGRRWVTAGGSIIVVGGEKDRSLGQFIEEGCGQSVVNLCGRTTVTETSDVLRRVGFLVTNDSGPMHLAALVGTPCIAVFSARDFPNKWFPRGEGHTVLRNDVDCSPCFLEECSKDHVCLTNIQVDEVWNAVIKTSRTHYAFLV